MKRNLKIFYLLLTAVLFFSVNIFAKEDVCNIEKRIASIHKEIIQYPPSRPSDPWSDEINEILGGPNTGKCSGNLLYLKKILKEHHTIENELLYDKLALALYYNQPEIAKYLIDNKIVDINTCYVNEVWGICPLEASLERGYIDIAKMIVDRTSYSENILCTHRGCDFTQYPLEVAARADNLDFARYLIEKGADITLVIDNRYDDNILQSAIKKNDLNFIKYLLDKGFVFYIDFLYNLKDPILSSNAIDLFISNGVDIKKENKIFLSKSIESGNLARFKYWLTKGILLEPTINTTYAGEQPLLYAALRFGGVSMAEYLLSIDKNISKINPEQDIDANVLLNITSLKWLLKQKTNPNHKNLQGRNYLGVLLATTPWEDPEFDYDYEANLCENCEEAASILIRSGAEVNLQDNKGNTAIFYVVQADDNSMPFYNKELKKKLIRILMENGSDLAIKNNENKSVLDYVSDQEIKEYILSLKK